MKLRFYKFRAILLLYLVRILSKILFIESTPVFSVGGIIKNKTDEMLFVDLSYQNGIGIPGGIINGGETIKDALYREIREETGLTVTKAKYLTSIATRKQGIPFCAIYFELETKGKIRSSAEGKLLWAKPQDVLDQLCYKDNRDMIKQLI